MIFYIFLGVLNKEKALRVISIIAQTSKLYIIVVYHENEKQN